MADAKRAAPGKGDPLQNFRAEDSGSTSTSAKQLQFHPLADIFPLMEGEEFDALVASIKANGQREPIITYEGMILDGRNRYRACLAAGVVPRFIDGDGIDDPVAYIFDANFHLRQLTPEGKRKALVKLVAAHPEKSDRELAKQAGVDHHQIARARKRAEATGTTVPVEKRVGKDGKARRQPTKKAKPADPVADIILDMILPKQEDVHQPDPEASAEAMKAAFAAAEAGSDVAADPPKRKLTKRQLKKQEQFRQWQAEADRVAAILHARLGRDTLLLVYAAMYAVEFPPPSCSRTPSSARSRASMAKKLSSGRTFR